MKRLFQTSDVMVLGNTHTMTIKTRFAYTAMVTAASVLIGGLLLALSGTTPLGAKPFGETHSIIAWGGYLFLGVSVLGLVAVAVRALRKPIIFDRTQAALRYRGRPIPFTDIDRIEVARVEIAGRGSVGIVLKTEAEVLPLLPLGLANHEQALTHLCQIMQRMVETVRVDRQPPAATEDTIAEDWGRRQEHELLAMIFLAVGMLWSIVGFLAIPDVVFSSRRLEHGFLLWPLGIWIAALGALELMGAPAYRWLTEGSRWRRFLFGGLWMGSYCVVSFV